MPTKKPIAGEFWFHYATWGAFLWLVAMGLKACSSPPMTPAEANACAKHAFDAYQRGEYDSAIRDFDKFLKFDKGNAKAYACRGAAWFAKGEPQRAIDDFDRAIELEPTVADHFYNRAQVHQSLGVHSMAIQDYSHAIAIGVNGLEPHNELAWLLATSPDESLRNGKMAVTHATIACKMTAETKASYLDTFAAAHAAAEDFAEAIRCQSKAIQIAPDCDKADYRARLALYKSGKPFVESPSRGPESR